ncbi:MAG: T9SS type A sorting domain-containing protein [Flavobacteriales bacterium]|nr:T9SS type A sorting domain-containing protein [Flavobacteriales bacterium]
MLYPNPFSNSTTIDYSLGEDCTTTGNCFIRLFDMSGRVIHQQNLSMMDNDGNGSMTIDMSRYDNGIYFCSLYCNRQLLQTEKLILMK